MVKKLIHPKMTQVDFQVAFDDHREMQREDEPLIPIGRIEDHMVNFQTYLLEWMR